MPANAQIGILGQSEVGTGSSWTTLYTVPSARFASLTIGICNRSGSARTASIRIRPGGATAANKHIIADSVALPNGTTLSTMEIQVAEGDVVEGVASGASVNMVVSGKEAFI